MPGYDKEKEPLSSFEYAIAGGISGAFTRFCCQPLDVVKIRFQLQVEPINRHSLSSKYHAVYQAMKTILVEEGSLGLWKGHNAGQLLSISYGFVQFQSFEMFTKAAHSYFNLTARSPNVHFVCGSLAGICATVVSFPFDVAKTRLIAQGNEKIYYSIFHAFKTMVRNEGIIALFKGMTPAMLLVAPQAGAMFTVHNIQLTILADLNLLGPNDVPSLGQNLFVGSMAGLVSKALVYPLDLSRKRLQMQGFQEGRIGFGENFNCKGMADCVYRTTKREGIKGLYKGLIPSIVKAAITTALHFTGYDVMCQLFYGLHRRF